MAVARAKMGKQGFNLSIEPNKYSIIDSFKVEKAKTTIKGEIFKFSNQVTFPGMNMNLYKLDNA